MTRAAICGMWAMGWLLAAAIAAGASGAGDEIKAYSMDRAVAEFPAKDDFSTPEAAYATVNRRIADGTDDWGAMSVERIAKAYKAPLIRRKLTDKQAAEYREARIVEVRTFRDSFAAVFARGANVVDIRSFELVDGRWLNAGNDVVKDLDAARERFARYCSYRTKPATRPAIADPAAHLKPFVDYLRTSAVEPKKFILDSLGRHSLVIIGEIHHRPTYWAMNAALVEDVRFPKRCDRIFLELPSNDQALVDEFLAAAKLDTAPIIEMLRDNLWMGWPDRPMLDFFIAVWKANHSRPAQDQVRLVLVDMARPWKEIQQREDWRKYEVDRDRFMVEKILKDLADSANEKRHALFIVGYAHAQTLRYRVGDQPIRTAGSYLRELLGKEVFTIVQHGPVLANMGGVSGRTCLGLFDAAFAANGNKPVAFALANSPFGEERFDANADCRDVTDTPYREAFGGYLYLGPLEDEVFSPLIDGFYTDEFVKELDRRYRMLNRKGLVEGLRLPELDGKSFVAWMSNEWGRPRRWREQLGPVDAWQYGDDWQNQVRSKQHRLGLERPELVRAEARRIFETIQRADYKSPQKLWELNYRVDHWYDVWIDWVCERFGKNPIRTIQLGEVTADKTGRPVVAYVLALADGSRMEGKLPMEYDPLGQSWFGTDGLDWHLKPAATTRPK